LAGSRARTRAGRPLAIADAGRAKGARGTMPARGVRGTHATALVAAARRGREQAVAPFSGFKVGAALEAENGSVVTGCNVENASYGLTMCAERVAVFKAVSEGHRAFRRIAVIADAREPTPPCGACRQILWEYGGDLEVILANLGGITGRWRMSELLPVPFDSGVLASVPPLASGPRRRRSRAARR
jgi:cytidine deaminase